MTQGRRVKLVTLTLAEREDISQGVDCGSSIRYIARGLKRTVSTVSREVARHGARPQYRANEANDQAWESALRPKACLLLIHKKLQAIVASKPILDWSPEQISGWLKIQDPQDESMRVSHETSGTLQKEQALERVGMSHRMKHYHGPAFRRPTAARCGYPYISRQPGDHAGG